MSKKLGLESKYKQFIKPTKLGEYKAIMGKGTSFTPTKSTFIQRSFTLSTPKSSLRSFPAKFLAKTALSVAKRSPIGKVVTAIGKAVTSKPGMFGAGIGIGANAKPEVFKNNKKMGGGMMKYKTGNAVKLSPKQKKIAAMAGNPKKIEAVDFDKLRTMKANKGIAVDFDKTTYNVKDVYKLANKNKTGDRTTSKDVREAARILKVKLPPKAR